jgi:flagellar basal-body rod protein FlgC
MLISNRYFSFFRTSARGLEAQRIALGTASENIANATTSRTAAGTPYAIKRTVQEVEDRHYALFSTVLNQKQTELRTSNPRHIDEISLRQRLPEQELGPLTEVQEEVRTRREFDPTHPHADAEGYVEYPDVNIVEEMAHMVSANRIYEANLSAVQAAKEMIKRTLEI